MKHWLFVAALLGALGVVMGAFAAHALSTRLDARMLAVFETAARYHMLHALAMGLAAFAVRGAAARLASRAAMLFAVGIALFSGSLYLLAWSGITWLGMVTPLGGLALISGWVVLAMAALKLE